MIAPDSLERMKQAVSIIYEQSDILQEELKLIEAQFKDNSISFFTKKVDEMGVSEKVRAASSLIKMKDQFVKGE